MKYEALTSRGIPKAQEVEPIKSMKDIAKIKQYLSAKKSKRDYTLFVVGINVGLRAGDLLDLTWEQLLDDNGKLLDVITIGEEKTDKARRITLNYNTKQALLAYKDTLPAATGYVFRSQKGGTLTVVALHKMIKTTMRDLNIKGNYGTHTLRKTFAYHAYMNGVPIETLQKTLNHSSAAVTLRYIGITQEVIADVYNSLNL